MEKNVAILIKKIKKEMLFKKKVQEILMSNKP
jgi:hypothetical protein